MKSLFPKSRTSILVFLRKLRKTARTLYLRKSKNLFYFDDLLVTGEFNHDVRLNPAVLKFYMQ